MNTAVPASPSLKAVDVACRRGSRLLFKGLSFQLDAGRIAWVRGQNGRGKTSLLRLAAGLSTPEQGEIRWGDVSVRRSADYRRQLVYIAHTNALKDDLSVTESLAFLLSLHGRPHGEEVIDAALERIGLQGRRHAPVRTLSQGQRRRVTLARLAVENTPSLWILDEPFDSLDVDGIARLTDLLAQHAQRGGRVLLTSHQPLDAQTLSPSEIDLDGLVA